MMRPWIFAVMVLVCIALLGGISQPIVSVAQTRPTPVDTDTVYTGRQFSRSDRLGITFISSAQIEPDDTRYQNALLLGAGWTRWPLYWNAVEVAPNEWDWSAYDELVINDMRYNLNINAILLDKPTFYADGEIIQGLNEPIFADGSDTPANGKALNPNNPWANFVYQAVQRYKPGGILARQQGWTSGQGVAIWEVWNEPDLAQFWRGGINNYARLLKVAYLAAHQADPTADVMFGGLLYSTPDNWLARVLAIYDNDPLARSNNWYMDAVAVHSYSYPWRTGWLTLFARQSLIAYGIDRPIFVNETGISIWDDYPGPVWVTSPEQRIRLGTADQQAWYFIQSTVYGWSEGASVVFFHQLYDDCGDQAAGTNFPPNNGDLCTQGQACFGDAFGLFRNTSNSICYSQHPTPGTARPAAAAFRLMADVFGAADFVYVDDTRLEGNSIFEFLRPASNERILVIWNRRFEDNTATIAASGSSAILYTLDRTSTITPQNGVYSLALNAAVPDSFPELEPIDISAIAGEPIILVEPIEGEAIPINATTSVQVEAPSVPVTSVPPTAGPIFNPTVAPENDTLAPTTFIIPLPERSASTFLVSWGAEDNGAIDRYVVWVQVNDGEWMPWLETQRQEGIYTGTPDNIYRFAVWAVDTAGNWSTNIDLTPQAQTQVQS
ncbi:MAG: fibronectin type III domain-containing protein [Phototrophicaceae bacterium]